MNRVLCRTIVMAGVGVVAGCGAGCGASLAGIADARNEGDRDRLLEYMSPDEHAYIRQYAAAALGRLAPTAPAVVAMQACVAAPAERHFVRIECARALRGWAQKDSAPVVIQALQGTGDPELRYWLAETLVILDTPEGWATIEQLRDDRDFLLYTAARDWTEQHQEARSAAQPASTVPVEGAAAVRPGGAEEGR